MKKLIPLFVFFIFLSLTGTAFATGVIYEEIIAVDSGTTLISSSLPAGVKSGTVQVGSGDSVRMAFGKVTVSSTVGILLDVGQSYDFYERGELVAARFTIDIGNVGSGASLYVIGYDYRIAK